MGRPHENKENRMPARKPARTNPGSYQELRMLAEALADAQEYRVSFENKDRSGTVPVEAFAATVELYQQAEENLRKEMVSCYRVTVPEGIRKWQESAAGIGESTLARLLGITGDPAWAYPKHWEGTGSERHLVEDEPHPRSISQLWQYTGHGLPKNRDVKGDAAALMRNGSPDAKKLVYLLSAAQVKSNAKGGAAYRHVYDEVKDRYAGRVHSTDCKGGYSGALYVKCKTHVDPDDVSGAHPLSLFASDEEDLALYAGNLAHQLEEEDTRAAGKKGKPGYALAGDPYQKSHVHAIAMRHTGKEILRDLWLAAHGSEPVYGRGPFPHGGIYAHDQVFGQ
jgi:hypothetical protein